MASESGSAMSGRDPAWKYCSPIEGNRNETIYNFCGLVMKSESITWFKSHLTHKDPHNNTKKCRRVPPEVKEEIRLLVHDKQKAKAKKNVDIEDIHSQLRGTMGTHHTHLVNEDDDDEDVEKMKMFRMKMCICIRQICTQMSGMHIDLQFMPRKHLIRNVNNIRIL